MLGDPAPDRSSKREPQSEATSLIVEELAFFGTDKHFAGLKGVVAQPIESLKDLATVYIVDLCSTSRVSRRDPQYLSFKL
jgi:hypothetical protein